MERTLDVGALFRCAYRASGGDTAHQSETHYKPGSGVGSTGTSELCRRHRRPTRDGEGRRKAIRTAPTDPLTWNPFLCGLGRVCDLAIGKSRHNRAPHCAPTNEATHLTGGLRPSCPRATRRAMSVWSFVSVPARHPTSMLHSPRKSTQRRGGAHMWRPVPRAADRNRLVPDWLRSRSLAPENWLHVSPGAASWIILLRQRQRTTPR